VVPFAALTSFLSSLPSSSLLQVEQFSEKPIEQMPVHVSDIFARDAA
jgi:hypothetical protein